MSTPDDEVPPIPPELENLTTRFWDRADLIRRMRRIEGQARGVQGMLERGEDCKAVLTQISAMSGALAQVARVLSACTIVEGLDAEIGPLDEGLVRNILSRLNQAGRL
ncbi:Metal-sensitive transcriptional regulator [Candidatus Hydrogenisulfobacillus filiaventi]|uniref:Metal-sensitive transcriptional regulator n=1 Tax=Candidatus Hydrogenisulfobacillus filiaventi TaxID=2707344 RepID=A0A6F8ZJ83_9FIRM|nr:metal-sensitive transcriptional regulator [Bacillota bacterium]CAB1129741.1 Metal-sensitive transcriptional regulator [Candidatus Hydrogenisulfobacillus filiaventi]